METGTGNDVKIKGRILSYTPMSQWNDPRVLHEEWKKLCQTAVCELGELPEEKRPPHYSTLVRELKDAQ